MKIFPILIVLLFSAAVFGQRVQAPDGWFKYTSPEGRYSVLMPKEPTLSTQEVPSGTGGNLKQYMAEASDANIYSMVGYFDLLSGEQYDFDKGRDGLVNGIKGTLVSEKAISIGGNPGREWRVSVKGSDGVDYIARARSYDVARRIYMVMCLFSKSGETPTTTDKCEKFFNSFSVETGK